MHPTFGRYELLKRLAGGGMGEVYLARQRGIEDQRLSLPGGPEIPFPGHAVPQIGRTLRLQLAASF